MQLEQIGYVSALLFHVLYHDIAKRYKDASGKYDAIHNWLLLAENFHGRRL